MALCRISQQKSTTSKTKCNLSVGKLGVFIELPYTTTLPIFLQKYCVLTEYTNDLSHVSGFVCCVVHPNWPPTAFTTAQRDIHQHTTHIWIIVCVDAIGSSKIFIELQKWWI
jgi:hypothetical protein